MRKGRRVYGGRVIGVLLLVIAIAVMIHGSAMPSCTDGMPDESGMGIVALIGFAIALITGKFRYI